MDTDQSIAEEVLRLRDGMVRWQQASMDVTKQLDAERAYSETLREALESFTTAAKGFKVDDETLWHLGPAYYEIVKALAIPRPGEAK